MVKRPIEMLSKRFSATKIESDVAGVPTNFDEELAQSQFGVNAWRPTLYLQKNKGSSTFHIPNGKLS